jgi:hypothetical protein
VIATTTTSTDAVPLLEAILNLTTFHRVHEKFYSSSPREIAHLIGDLRSFAEDFARTGEWLSTAMQASWDMAAALVDIDELVGVLGERHWIIANDWQAANISSLIARLLTRAADMLDRIDFSPAALRRDLR